MHGGVKEMNIRFWLEDLRESDSVYQISEEYWTTGHYRMGCRVHTGHLVLLDK
jgi:hypothetical protein